VKPFTTLAIVVLSLMALLQLARAILSWAVVVNGIAIPLWVSGITCVVAAICAANIVRDARR
jgi:hypothetical protein